MFKNQSKNLLLHHHIKSGPLVKINITVYNRILCILGLKISNETFFVVFQALCLDLGGPTYTFLLCVMLLSKGEGKNEDKVNYSFAYIKHCQCNAWKKVSSQYLEITKTYTKNSIAYFFFSNTVDLPF